MIDVILYMENGLGMKSIPNGNGTVSNSDLSPRRSYKPKVRSLRRKISGRRNRKEETSPIEEEFKKRELDVSTTNRDDKTTAVPLFWR